MDDRERTVVTHYNLPTAYPTEWPKELDDSDDDDDGPDAIGVRRSRSRYSALERTTSERKSLIPGSQQTKDGRANLVSKDEQDALGAHQSVMNTLRRAGMKVDDDSRLRNKFMLSSTTFSPGMFLSVTHREASTEDLLRGLEYLTRSIDQKSSSLKALVETNFERFVRAKATIDNVYTEMRNQGVEPVEQPGPTSPRHSRRTSGIHFRNISSGSAAGMSAPPPKPSKNALRKETDYGVQGIRVPLLEVSQKAQDVWGPALGGKERENNLKAIADAVTKDRMLYELGSDLNYAIKQKDYDKAVELYDAARRYVADAKTLSDGVVQYGRTLSDEEVHRILAIGRMWTDAEEQVKALKRDIWRKLSNVSSTSPLPGASQAEEHMELICVLLHLGVEESPIWVFLLSRYDYLKNKIAAVVERSKIEIEILRRRLAAGNAPSSDVVATFLRQASKDRPEALDTDDVIDFWHCIQNYLTKMLSVSNGLLGEVVDFWESAQSFLDSTKQNNLPSGWDGESRKHHTLSESDTSALRSGLVELIGQLRDAVFSLFADPPTEDISSLFSPAPGSAATPTTPLTGSAFSPTDGRIGRLDPQNLPAAAAKKGEPWEDFAFWPPHSNALSAVHYLEKILALVGAAANEMASLGPVNSSASYEKIRVMISGARERCMRAVCEAWSKDAESCKSLEDWVRAPEKRDQTRMPGYFEAFERKVLLGMQQVLYFSNTNTKPGSRDIITPPSTKLLQMVRTQFVSSVYKAVSGMLENAEASRQGDEDDWVLVTSLDSITNGAVPNETVTQDAINASSRNVRMLLTMSNLKALRNEHVPSLIQVFESSFSVKLAEESKTIRDVFGQIDAKLFHSYTRPMVAALTKIIKEGINTPDWAPKTSRPDQVRPYVYAALMTLVMVHTEVSTTVSSTGSSSPLLSEILSFLVENISQALLDGFKERKPNTYTLPALMQATLDTEFIAQTMSQYATAKASEVQGQIYTELDKRTTNEARTRLQQELGDMRVVLKKLREGSRNSFGCFKKQRPSDKDRGRPERKATGT
ncbi:Exocyst complex component S5 [Knufia peltigerae]|uniref:Exocyst complex component SEC5 n=1 Tax=Knufia peltigerae TaxID=1002370 RepID=A0AA39CJ97_9EURO|nr:Exocyst complex component S5 [Knufia peltigerae]